MIEVIANSQLQSKDTLSSVHHELCGFPKTPEIALPSQAKPFGFWILDGLTLASPGFQKVKCVKSKPKGDKYLYNFSHPVNRWKNGDNIEAIPPGTRAYTDSLIPAFPAAPSGYSWECSEVGSL